MDMNEGIRGSIEHRIDDELESRILNEDVKWVFDTIPISSKKDFLSGFVVGKLITTAWTILVNSKEDATNQDLQDVKELIMRRLPEIQRKIVTELNR